MLPVIAWISKNLSGIYNNPGKYEYELVKYSTISWAQEYYHRTSVTSPV